MTAVLGISRQALNKLAQSGVVSPVKRGRWDAAETVQRYIAHRVTGVEQARAAPGAERLRDARALEVEQRIAEKARDLIQFNEAQDAFDRAVGLFVESLSGLPARLTRDEVERQRIEAICDHERQRLSDRFAKIAIALETGRDPVEAGEEADA